MKCTMTVLALMLYCMTTLVHDALAQSPPVYNYNESSPYDPAHWGDLDPAWAACKSGSMRQSPIQITPDILRVNVTLGDLDVEYAATTPANVSHNTHTPKVTVAKDAGLLTIDGVVYTLDDFHFHIPSEHKFLGYSFPMELHLVHVAEADPTQFAVIALLYLDGVDNNTFLGQFLEKLPSYTNTMETSIGDIMLPSILNSNSLYHYFRYMGSLTTPPCSETVTWTIIWPIDQFAGISPSQLMQLRSTMPENNARPSQLPYGRLLSFNGEALPPSV